MNHDLAEIIRQEWRPLRPEGECELDRTAGDQAVAVFRIVVAGIAALAGFEQVDPGRVCQQCRTQSLDEVDDRRIERSLARRPRTTMLTAISNV